MREWKGVVWEGAFSDWCHCHWLKILPKKQDRNSEMVGSSLARDSAF
jgi:hypothetical protein